MAVEPQRKLTYEDYLTFPDDGLRRELIEGEVHVTPSPTTRHQEIVVRLVTALQNHLQAHGGGMVVPAPLDVVLSKSDVVQPDVLFVADADAGVITEANVQGAPTLAVEVLSDAVRDRRTKRDLYARFGVHEYWVVDPDADRMEVHRRTGGCYPEPEVLVPGDVLTTPLLPGLHIDVEGLLRREARC